MKHIKG